MNITRLRAGGLGRGLVRVLTGFTLLAAAIGITAPAAGAETGVLNGTPTVVFSVSDGESPEGFLMEDPT